MKRPQAGFSLLELLVAMVIMASSLGMLYQASTGALRGLGDYAQQQRAGLLAQSLMDARDAVPPGGWDESGTTAGFAWKVATTPLPLPAGVVLGTPVLHDVQVLVTWEGRFGQRQLQLQTLLPEERNLQASPAQR